MSTNELNNLRYLPGEIALLQKQIRETLPLTRDRNPEMREAARDLIALYRKRLAKIQAEYKRGTDFIQSIPDPWTQTAFRLRYIDGLPWLRVSLEMNQEPDTVKKMVYRYMERSCTAAADTAEGGSYTGR